MIPNTSKEDQYDRENSSQINKLRGMIRKTAYLLHPFKELEHKSICGKTILNEGLRSFEPSAKANMIEYVAKRLTDGEKCKLTPVYVTEDEFIEASKVENLTKAEIKFKIFELLDQVDNDISIFYEDIFAKTVKNSTKQKYIEFYTEVMECVDEYKIAIESSLGIQTSDGEEIAE